MRLPSAKVKTEKNRIVVKNREDIVTYCKEGIYVIIKKTFLKPKKIILASVVVCRRGA